MLSQIAWDGSQKLPFRILDTVRDNLHANRDINLLCIPIAAWCLFVSRKAKAGESITDPKATALIERATRHAFDPVAVTNDLLNETTIFAELSANSLFRDHVLAQVKTLSAWSTQDVDETLNPILEDL